MCAFDHTPMVVYIQCHMSSHVKLCARVRKMCFFFRMWCILQIQTHIWKYSTTFCFFPENRATQCTHANPHMKVLHHLAHSLWVPIIYFRVACESFSLKKEHIYVHSHSITIEWHLTYSTPQVSFFFWDCVNLLHVPLSKKVCG